ncbi:hypothetical protein HOA59_00740 [archaeon]|jgi:HTH-type transcriptional regulator, sugar sensing transcriptional regulator|nr:hypothetical protein [archaeon]MBT6823946.1 hypothetical protein [archaeon]MBT7107176.1 hypothetical protein [archaeon]MBT7297754.1 hypothetical protein [archaeon]
MILSEDFLKKLKGSFSLNEYEVKVWTALLSKGIATAGELSDISDVPRSRSYDVLEALEKRGFVIMNVGKPIKYISVDPHEVISRVKKEIKNKSDSKIKSIEKLNNTDVFDEINTLFSTGIEHVNPNLISGSIRGRKNIYNQIEELLNGAEKSITIATTKSGISRKLASFSTLIKSKSKKGVKVRIMAPEVEDIENISKIASVKNVKNLNARFIMVDDKEVLFMLTDDDVHETSDSGIWVKSPFFVNAMSNLVESTWNK